jgi:carbamoyltransferase
MASVPLSASNFWSQTLRRFGIAAGEFSLHEVVPREVPKCRVSVSSTRVAMDWSASFSSVHCSRVRRLVSSVAVRVLGVNAVFHDPAAALVLDGAVVAAAEEERFTRRKHGKAAVPFSTWELPEQSAAWCLRGAGLQPKDLDAVAYSYDPALAPKVNGDVTADAWEGLRTLYAERAPLFLQSALPGLDPAKVRFVPHHVAHAASAHFASPYSQSSVMVFDGRGERASYLAGRYSDGGLEILATQDLPHSLGLLYEELTEHVGFMRSSDEYKVMALASYGRPRFLDVFRNAVRPSGDGGFRVDPTDLGAFAPPIENEDELTQNHADLASTMQVRLQEVLLDLARWLRDQTGDVALTMAGGVALNCVANSFIQEHGPFDEVWVQPAAGDAGTALGAALQLAYELGDVPQPMETAALGRSWNSEEIEGWLRTARVGAERPPDISATVADVIARNGIVAWFQGRSEYGPRALGHRSLLANASDPANLSRLNDVKGREQFRPVAPMVTLERAPHIFEGPIPSPYMLFTHRVRESWRDRIPAVVHVDGTARIQTVDRTIEPLLARLLDDVEKRTGVPVVVNTSLNTAGRPMVDDPRDALECFGSSPIDALAIGPYLVRRAA